MEGGEGPKKEDKISLNLKILSKAKEKKHTVMKSLKNLEK